MRSYAFWPLLIALLPLILWRPFWGVIIYSGFNIIRPEMLFWGGGAARGALFILFGATILGTLLNFRNLSIKAIMRREVLLILWLYIGIIVSLELSQYQLPEAYYYANEIFKIALLCSLLAALLDNPQKVIRYENVLLLFVVLLSIWGIEQYFRGNVRLEGLGGHDSNGVAAVGVLFFPLALLKLLVSGDKREKVIGFISVSAVVLLIILTESRGGFLGLMVAIVAMILRSKEKKRIIVMLFLITAVAAPFITERYKSRLATMRNTESLDVSARSRLILWQAGMKIFRDNPVFGTGYLSFPLEKMRYQGEFYHLEPDFRKSVFRNWNPRVTHNTYIQILSESGLFAAVPYFLLIIGTFLSNRRVRKIVPRNNENKDMLDLLSAIEYGVIGCCVCLFFINGVGSVFLPVQIVVCSIIREFVVQRPGKLAVST